MAELGQLEVRLREADGRRVWLHQRARADLAERGEQLTRLSVARRACQLLDDLELTPCCAVDPCCKRRRHVAPGAAPEPPGDVGRYVMD